MTYEKILENYRISDKGLEETNPDDYDVIYGMIGYGYANHRYKIYKNSCHLSNETLAKICDEGRLPFGYRVEGDVVVVYTD